MNIYILHTHAVCKPTLQSIRTTSGNNIIYLLASSIWQVLTEIET